MGILVIFAFPKDEECTAKKQIYIFRLDESILWCEFCDVVGVDVITYCEFTCGFCPKDDFILLIRKLETMALAL